MHVLYEVTEVTEVPDGCDGSDGSTWRKRRKYLMEVTEAEFVYKLINKHKIRTLASLPWARVLLPGPREP